jgi:hypothetical protein
MWDKSWTRRRTEEARFQPRVGLEFDLHEVRVLDARSRGFLLRAFTVGACGAVTVAGIYSLVTGNFVAIEVVWAVAGPMFGAMVTYYFGPAGKHAP